MRVPLTTRDFLDRAELVYGDRIGVVDEPDQPASSLGELSYREVARRGRAMQAGLDELGIREGERVAIVGYGSGVGRALGAADLLAEGGLDVTVADARFAKPLDAALLARLAASHELLVTVEEGVLPGGFGSGVWETLAEADDVARVMRVGLPDRYVTHGSPKLLHEEVGFTGEAIAERIEAAVLDPRGSLAGA